MVAELKTLSNMLVARACELKPDIFEKFEINISTRRIQTKLCTVKAYFTLIDFRRILKGLEDLQVFLDMKYRGRLYKTLNHFFDHYFVVK